MRPETTSEDWLRVVEDCAGSPSTAIIIGPPASGKSTFVKRLLNRHLTGQGKSARPVPAVCLLDLDHAQPEYTTQGQISLTVVRSLNLGPAFTHPASSPSPSGSRGNETVRSHAVPTNLANYTAYYSACAEDLFLAYKTLRSQDPLLPLIINTSGSLHSSDFDVLTDLILRFKTHYVVHLGDMQATDTEHATKLHVVQAVVSQYRGTLHGITAHFPTSTPMRSDTELRAMHSQSYFHLKHPPTSKMRTSIWSYQPLSHLIPWEFCYAETPERTQDFVGFAIYSEPIEPASLAQSLNGSIVHIVESTSSRIPSPHTALTRTDKYRIPYFEKSRCTGMVEPLDPKTSRLLCTALVRGFDPEKHIVQVLVPMIHESLLYNLTPERTVFVGGCCDVPDWAYLENAYAENEKAVNAAWVENMGVVEAMGYLNTVRRVRKFQT